MCRLDGIDIIVGTQGAPVYAFAVGADEHMGAVGREFKAVEAIDLLADGLVHVKDYGYGLSRTEGVADDLAAVVAELQILVGAADGCHADRPAGGESTLCHILQGELPLCLHGDASEEDEGE